MSQDQESSGGRGGRDSQQGGLQESCGVGGRLRGDAEESVSTEAEAPSRGRKPLPQAGSQGAGVGGAGG